MSLLVGIARLVTVMVFQPPSACSGLPDTRHSVVMDIPYLYVASMLFFLTLGVAVIISLCTDPPTYKNVRIFYNFKANKAQYFCEFLRLNY